MQERIKAGPRVVEAVKDAQYDGEVPPTAARFEQATGQTNTNKLPRSVRG